MNYKVSRSASSINKEAKAIQQGNTLPVIGGLLVVSLVSGLFTWAFEMIFNVDTAQPTSLIATLVMIVLALFITNPLNIGVNWSVLRLVDEDFYHIGNVFEPFKRKYMRNVANNLLYSIVVGLWGILILAVVLGLAYLAFFLIGDLAAASDLAAAINTNPAAIQNAQVLNVFTGLAGAFVPIFGLAFLIIFILLTIVTLRFALNDFLLFDNDRLSAARPLKISKTMMKGNKGKLFLIGFQNFIIPTLFSIVATALLVLVGVLVDSGVLIGLLSIILVIAIIVISILYSVRNLIATALFYRLFTDEHGSDLDGQFSDLDLTPDVPENDYHTGSRPAFTEDATAIHPANDVATGQAANQAVNRQEPVTDVPDAEATPTDAVATTATAGGAAAVFSLADEEQAGAENNDEYDIADGVEAEKEEQSAAANGKNGASSALRGSYTVGQEPAVNQPFVSTFDNDGEVASAIKDNFVVESSDYNRPVDRQPVDRPNLNAGPASESVAVRQSFTVGQANADANNNDQESESGEKKPYNIMGYNTPERTDFGKVENAKDVILAADKAESSDEGVVNADDFESDVDYDPEIDPKNKD